MKANVLMIGDWVKLDFYDVPYGDEDDAVWKNGKVTAIHHGNWVDVNFGGHLDERDIEVEDVQPIPLTPDILEKNGFRKLETYGTEKWLCNNIRLNVYSSDGTWRFCADTNRNENSVIYIHFVHQLQNALRLCGIEEEITL